MSQSEHSNNNERVSVVIPCHNGERFLAQAIESVEAQTMPVHEIIVVDDGSTDGSVDVARNFSSVSQLIVREHCGGPGSARNDGIASASGQWIALLDADDVWHPDKLAYQMQSLSSDNPLQVLTCMVEEFISEEMSAEDDNSASPTLPLRKQVASIPSAMLFSRDTFNEVGTFTDNDHQGRETINWVLKAQACNTQFTPVEKAIVYRRIHKNNLGRMKPETLRSSYLLELKRSLDARRKK